MEVWAVNNGSTVDHMPLLTILLNNVNDFFFSFPFSYIEVLVHTYMTPAHMTSFKLLPSYLIVDPLKFCPVSNGVGVC